MPYAEATNISADAGDESALSNPNSPEAISRRAQQIQQQSSEDKRYDPAAPEQGSASSTLGTQGFQDYIIVWENSEKRSKEISAGLFLALGVMLFLYKVAPDAN